MTDPLSLWKAVVLGVVEGVTEFLPISSTGHLLITERLLGISTSEQSKAAADSYIVAIQLGAILAVLGIYRQRFVTMIDGVRGRSEGGRAALLALFVAFLPAAAIGFLAGDSIKEHLLAPWPVAGAFLVGGVAILVVGRLGWSHPERTRFESVTDITLPAALVIGLTQALALWPGTSRSLVTILAALAIGVSLPAAVEFAFLLGFVDTRRRQRLRAGEERLHDRRHLRLVHPLGRRRRGGGVGVGVGQGDDRLVGEPQPRRLRLLPDRRSRSVRPADRDRGDLTRGVLRRGVMTWRAGVSLRPAPADPTRSVLRSPAPP